MFPTFRTYVLIATLLCFGSGAWGQELRVADGSSSGTYQAMFKEIRAVCGGALALSEVPSGGAVENLDKLVGNEANAAFLHSDVIAFRAKTEDLSAFKTLLALYPEEVHFLAKSAPYVTAPGTLGFGKQERVLRDITDLVGLKVGAAGGGYITAQSIRLQGEVAYGVVQYHGGKEVFEALQAGQIAAAVFVGAAPLPNLRDLGPDYRLLSIGEAVRDRLKAVYRPATVTYTRLSVGSVPTVAADALLVTREYKTAKFVEALRAFRQCFLDKLDELKETTGNHKAWQKVEADTVPRWPLISFGPAARR